MDITADNIIVNSCEYTPVYLIPNPSVTQAGSYIISQRNQDVSKPVIDNLKSFYESSGNLENGILSSPKKPRILRKQSPTVIGNNLKLASFLLPKNDIPIIKKENMNKEYFPPRTEIPFIKKERTKEYFPPVTQPVTTPMAATQAVFKPVVTSVNTSVVNMVPKVEVDSKIVKIGAIPLKRTNYGRILPKRKPRVSLRESTTSITNPNPSKHTSVQLLKLGETYHSLNQLSDEQMKIVSKALNLFSDPENIPKEPAYDPVTNTKFIYKVVSPRDLTVVGKNNIEIKHSKKKPIKKVEKQDNEQERSPNEPTVTRSGRTVKMPKQMCEDTPTKPRKKSGSIINCFQCSSEFCSLYRLQRHYEIYPTHIPAKIHSNLFHCLLAIMESGSEDDQASIFIQQLEQLIEKLKTLLPCLLKKIDGREGRLCTINDDIGRLFGMSSGKYNLNMDAVNCVKDKDGHCIHNPPPKNNQFSSDMSKPSQLWLSKHNEELANNEAETEDCARINSVDKWHTTTKRNWKLKQQKSQKSNAKRMRLASESEQFIELGTDDVATFSKSSDDLVIFNKPEEESAINLVQNNNATQLGNNNEDKEISQKSVNNSTSIEDQNKKSESAYMQFYSAHFDIRSSPIKPSALVRKFQIDPKKFTSYEVQIMRPLALDKPNETANEIIQTDSDNLQFFRDNEIAKATGMNADINFGSAKEWTISTASCDEQSNDSFMKSNILFESALTPIKENNLIEPSLIHIKNKPNVLFETSSKTANSIEPSLLNSKNGLNTFFDASSRSDSLIAPTLLQTKPNRLGDSALLNSKDESNGFFVPSSRSDSLIRPTLHTKTSFVQQSLLNSKDGSNDFFTTSRSDTLIAPSLIQEKPNSLVEPSLLNSKDGSSDFFDQPSKLIEPVLDQNKLNTLLEQSLLHLKDKSNGLFEPSPICVKSKPTLIESPFNFLKDKSNSLFETALSHVKDRSNNLFESTSLHKVKNSLIGPSLIHAKEENSFYETVHRKHDVLFEPALLHENKTSVNIDENHSDHLNTSNQGQSVLNFLESLGNELAYPETEIRNNSVDFQLDLFSFNSS